MEIAEIQRYKNSLRTSKAAFRHKIGETSAYSNLNGKPACLTLQPHRLFQIHLDQKKLGNSINRRLLCPAKRKPAREKFMCI